MDTPNPNGATDSSIDIVERRYRENRRARDQYESESELRRQEYQAKIELLLEERSRAMSLASDHAGQIGLIYHARTNSFARVIVVDDLPALNIERPKLSAEVSLGLEPVGPVDETSSDGKHPEEGGLLVASVSTAEETAGMEISPEPQPSGNAVVESPTVPQSTPSPPRVPERPRPPAPVTPDAKWERNANFKSGVVWLASIFVGLFVGFGLLSLTGLPYQRPSDRLNLIGFLTLGVAAIAGMKFLFDSMWFEAGRRRALGTSEWHYTTIISIVSGFILLVEAVLGGQALVFYTQRSSFQNEGGLPLWQMVLLAAAVSSANLLYSAFVGFQKGGRSITAEDVHRQQYEIEVAEHLENVAEIKAAHERELRDWQLQRNQEIEVQQKLHEIRLASIDDHRQAHDEKLTHWREEVTRATTEHGEGLSERSTRTDEFESFRKLPDFQALCKFIGVVETLNLQIEELRRALTNDSISRGHNRKNVM